jgi:hypothetical protein
LSATIPPSHRRLIETEIPTRLERLPWGGFHRLVVAAFGVTWILDGLEVTLAGSHSGALKASQTIASSGQDVGLAYFNGQFRRRSNSAPLEFIGQSSRSDHPLTSALADDHRLVSMPARVSDKRQRDR